MSSSQDLLKAHQLTDAETADIVATPGRIEDVVVGIFVEYSWSLPRCKIQLMCSAKSIYIWRTYGACSSYEGKIMAEEEYPEEATPIR